MPRKFALTSTGPMSGKSTLARHLESEYGFMRADHSRTLVAAFVEDWNDSKPLSGPITVEEVYRDKETWRPLLQEFGYLIGFNAPEKARYWMERTLHDWYREKSIGRERDVVFDSFRGETQAEVMRGLGFELVQIEISDTARCIRAGLLGKNCKDVLNAMRARPELEHGIARPDIILNGELPVDVLGKILMHRREDFGDLQIFGSHI